MRINRHAICVFCLGVFIHVAAVRGGVAAMAISLPNGAPLVLSPSGPTPVQIQIATHGDTVVAGSVALFHRVAPGAFAEIPMTAGASGAYSAALPAAVCGTTVQWYVEAEGVLTGVVTAPSGGSGGPFEAVVGTTQPIISFDFQTATGWTVSGTAIAGMWALGVPVGCNRGDPPADFDGSGSCYLTGPSLIVSPPTCDSDVDGGLTRVVSPVFNLSAHANPHVRYARWFSNVTAGGLPDDALTVQISEDGGSAWLPLETVGPTTQDDHPEVNGGWHPRILRIGGVVTNLSAVRFRMTAFDLGAASTVEAGLDAFAIVNLSCGGVSCVRGDVNQDGQVNGRDVSRFTQLLVVGGASPVEICAGDLESPPDGALDAGDISAFVSCVIAGGCG